MACVVPYPATHEADSPSGGERVFEKDRLTCGSTRGPGLPGVGGWWWNVIMTTQLVGPEVPVFEGTWEQPDAASTALLARVVGQSSTGLALGVPLADAERVDRLSALEDLKAAARPPRRCSRPSSTRRAGWPRQRGACPPPSRAEASPTRSRSLGGSRHTPAASCLGWARRWCGRCPTRSPPCAQEPSASGARPSWSGRPRASPARTERPSTARSPALPRQRPSSVAWAPGRSSRPRSGSPIGSTPTPSWTARRGLLATATSRSVPLPTAWLW